MEILDRVLFIAEMFWYVSHIIPQQIGTFMGQYLNYGPKTNFELGNSITILTILVWLPLMLKLEHYINLPIRHLPAFGRMVSVCMTLLFILNIYSVFKGIIMTSYLAMVVLVAITIPIGIYSYRYINRR